MRARAHRCSQARLVLARQARLVLARIVLTECSSAGLSTVVLTVVLTVAPVVLTVAPVVLTVAHAGLWC